MCVPQPLSTIENETEFAPTPPPSFRSPYTSPYRTKNAPPLRRYSSAAHVLRDTLAKQGVWGLYAGIMPNFLKVLPPPSY